MVHTMYCSLGLKKINFSDWAYVLEFRNIFYFK